MSKRYCIGGVIVSRAARSGRLAVVAGVVAGGLWSAGTAGTAWGQAWIGLGTTNNWSTAANWSGGVPANNGTASVVFDSSGRLTPVQDAAWSINGLSFNAGVASYTLTSPYQLTIGAGGINLVGAGPQSITNPVGLSASQTWTGNGNFSVSGNVLLGTNTLTLSPTLPAGATISGVISGSSGTALNVTSGIVMLSGSASNTFSGAVNVLSGATLTLAKSTSVLSVAGSALNIGNGSGAAGTAVVSLTASYQIGSSTAVSIASDGTLKVNSLYANIGALTMAGGSIAIGGGGLTLGGNVTVNDTTAGAVITASDDNYDLNLNGTRTFNVSSGGNAYDLDMNGVGLDGGAIVKTGNGVLRIGGASINALTGVTLQQGTLAVAGGGAALGPATSTLTLAGGVLQPDTGAADPGYLLVNNSVTQTGTVTLGQDGQSDPVQFQLGYTVTGNHSLQINIPTPAYNNDFSTYFEGGITASGVGNSLTFTAPSPATVAWGAGSYSGNFTIGANVTLIDFAVPISGSVTNSAGGTFESYYLNTGTFSGTLDNLGTISFTYSTSLDVQGGILNQAPLTLTAGESVTAEGLGLNNQAPITLLGGYVGGGGPFVNYSTVSGYGTIGGAGTFANYGYLYNSGGALTFAEVGGATNYGNFYVYSLSTGSAIQIASGTSLTNSGSMTLGPGVVISGPGGFSNAAGGTLSGAALITAPFYNGPGGLVTETSGALAITTPYTNAGSIYLAGVTASVTGGAITNTGSIEGFGTVGSAVNNSAGTIEAIGGILNLYGGLTNGVGGTIAVDAGTKTLVSPGLAVNAGVISLTGGTYDNGGAALNNTGSITGYGIIRTGGTGLTNSGVVTLTGGTTTVNGPVTNAATHSFAVQYNPAIFTGFFQNNGTLYVTATTASFGGGSGGGAALGAPTPNSAVSLEGTGGTVVSPGAVLSASGVIQASLTVQGIAGSYGRVTIPTQEPSGATPSTGRAVGQTVSILGTLNIASNGSGYLGDVDLADNDLIVTGMTEAAVRSYVASWYDGGKRDGLGLSSDLAGTGAGGSGPDSLATLAVITNSNGEGGPLFASFDGISVTANDVLVKYTYIGDTNLDGVVDGQDLANTLAGLSGGLTGWVNGDFTYSGSVTSADVTLVLNTLAHQTASFGDSGGSSGAVPEPSGLLWAASVLPALGRRRR